MGFTKMLGAFAFNPLSLIYLLDFIFSGLSYHLEMPELGEHKSPAGKGAPTEGLRSGFLEAQC